MLRKLPLKALALALSICFCSNIASATSAQSTEERFQDLFVTAGYCTAFGAALGTAMLAFQRYPADNLQYVAMGASLGFIGGSILGSYIIFSPMVTEDGDGGHPVGTLAADSLLPDHGIVLRPTYNRDTHRIDAIESGMTLARF